MAAQACRPASRGRVSPVGARCRGFSLLEVLIAFAILAVSFSVLMQVFSTGLRNISVGDDYTRAVLLAESLLARVGVEAPLAAGEHTGAFDDTYRWRVVMTPYDLKKEEQAQRAAQRLSGQAGQSGQARLGGLQSEGIAPLDAETPLPVQPLEVLVQVLWRTPGGERSVELVTLRLQAVEPGTP